MSSPQDWETCVAAGQCLGIDLSDLAREHGTPCFVYRADLIEAACEKCLASAQGLGQARVCYAVKANGNLGVLRQVLASGLGCDVASGLELHRARTAGASPGQVIFTGPGKSEADLASFIEWQGGEIVCDGEEELARISKLAGQAGVTVTVGLRVNPDIAAGGHPHISTGTRSSKFGVPPQVVMELMQEVAKDPRLAVGSLNFHIGSQVDSIEPYKEGVATLMGMLGQLQGMGITPRLDIGGGFAIGEHGRRPEKDVFAGLCDWLADAHPGVAMGFQPGRLIVGRAGVLLTRVEYVKGNNVIVDAGMTELLRPALYDAHHAVAKVGQEPAGPGSTQVVGPVCESADWLVRDCDLAAKQGDLLAIFDAGAYAAAMMSNYNGRLRPCEIILSELGAQVARRRESLAEAVAQEA